MISAIDNTQVSLGRFPRSFPWTWAVVSQNLVQKKNATKNISKGILNPPPLVLFFFPAQGLQGTFSTFDEDLHHFGIWYMGPWKDVGWIAEKDATRAVYLSLWTGIFDARCLPCLHVIWTGNPQLPGIGSHVLDVGFHVWEMEIIVLGRMYGCHFEKAWTWDWWRSADLSVLCPPCKNVGGRGPKIVGKTYTYTLLKPSWWC